MINRRQLLVGGATATAVTLAGVGLRDRPATARPAAGQLGATQIARITGADSISQTGPRWGVYGADLGHAFVHKGKMWLTFGDTYGSPAASDFTSVTHRDWRSNTMAWLSLGQDPSRGLSFDGMITDTPGHAKELLPSLKKAGVETTVIPTYGTGIGDRMFLHYMSVRSWGAPGHWTLNHAGIAYSEDDGNTWSEPAGARWPGDSNFGQVAFVGQGGYLYLFGIPGGRYGGVQLARVLPSRILDLDAYAYWDGRSWQARIADAATIVPAPVGELSVSWNSYSRRWLMMYLNNPAGQIVIRSARALTGPWTPETVVTTGQQFPQPYAPYITPLWNDGSGLFFTMSRWGPYAVYLMRTDLARLRTV